MAEAAKRCIKRLTDGGVAVDDCVEDVATVMEALFDGQLTAAQTAAFLTALKMRGETPAVVAACAASMQRHAVQCDVGGDCVDIVGTGGDGQDTFNVSTASAIVCAAAGLRVAKHGNRASSSACGSADILEAGMGARLDIGPQAVKRVLAACDFCFLFAQRFHPAMRHVAPVRRELGIRTVFNILGPLSNPTRPRALVVGVYAPALGELVARTFVCQGVARALVVCGQEGLDELSPAGPSDVWEVRDGQIAHSVFAPDVNAGLELHPLTAVKGAGPRENAATLVSLFEGKERAVEDYCALNAGALLYVGGKAESIKEGVALARHAIRSGAAMRTLRAYVAATNEVVPGEDGN